MDIIPLVIYLATLALTGIIIWYVCDALTMPDNIRTICRLLICLIFILAGVHAILAGQPGRQPIADLPSIDRGPASIMKGH